MLLTTTALKLFLDIEKVLTKVWLLIALRIRTERKS